MIITVSNTKYDYHISARLSRPGRAVFFCNKRYVKQNRDKFVPVCDGFL